jgi:hypothetical protein
MRTTPDYTRPLRPSLHVENRASDEPDPSNKSWQPIILRVPSGQGKTNQARFPVRAARRQSRDLPPRQHPHRDHTPTTRPDHRPHRRDRLVQRRWCVCRRQSHHHSRCHRLARIPRMPPMHLDNIADVCLTVTLRPQRAHRQLRGKPCNAAITDRTVATTSLSTRVTPWGLRSPEQRQPDESRQHNPFIPKFSETDRDRYVIEEPQPGGTGQPERTSRRLA